MNKFIHHLKKVVTFAHKQSLKLINMLKIKFWATTDLLFNLNLRLKNWHHANFYFIGLTSLSFLFNTVNVCHSATLWKIKLWRKHLTLSNSQLLTFHHMIMGLTILKIQSGLIKMVVEQDHGFIKAALSLVISKLSRICIQWGPKC